MEIQEINPVGVLYFDAPIGRRRAIREHLDDQGIPYEEDRGLTRSWFVARPDRREAMNALKAWLEDHGVR